MIGLIYMLIDPRDKACRYVGKTLCAATRLRSHQSLAYQGNRLLFEWLGTVKGGLASIECKFNQTGEYTMDIATLDGIPLLTNISECTTTTERFVRRCPDFVSFCELSGQSCEETGCGAATIGSKPMDVRVFSTALICVGVNLMLGWFAAISAGLILAALAQIQNNYRSNDSQRPPG